MLKLRFAGLALLVLAVGFTLGCGDKATEEPAETGNTGVQPADDGVYVAKNDSLEELQKAAEALELKISDVGEIEVHRGGNSDLVTLYWPQKDVTKEGLQTYRVDVGDEYEDDGKLEFRVGRKVLYSEPFAPEDTVTVGAIPPSVLDAIKRGKTVKWGVFFEGRNKKKTVDVKFKVVDGKKAAKRLQKLEDSKHFRRQAPLTRELYKTQVLEDNRLYSEALVQYLGILQVWPESIQPFRGIVSCCRRMDLKDTTLFTIASSFVRGKGDRTKYGGATNQRDKYKGSGTPGTPQAHTGEAKLALRAPTYQDRGPKGFRTTRLTPHGAEGGSSQPGTAQPAGPGTPVQPGRQGEIDALRATLGKHASQLQARATTQKQEAERLGTLLQTMKDAEKEVAFQQSQVTDRQSAYDQAAAAAQDLLDKKESNHPDSAKPGFQEELSKAIQDRDAAEAALEKAKRDTMLAEAALRKLKTDSGMQLEELEQAARSAEAMANHLQSEADKAREAFEMATGTEAQKEHLRNAARAAEHENQVAEQRADLAKARQDVLAAAKKVQDLEAAYDALTEAQKGQPAGLQIFEELKTAREDWANLEQVMKDMQEALDALMGG